MSTAFHPQTDGQTERAEHAYKTAVSETTKMSPFFANYGYQPETQWIRPPESQAESEFTNPASELLIARWQGIWNHLQENTHNAQQRLAKWHLSTKHPSKKLDHIKPRRFRGVGKNPLRLKSSMARSSG
jgi:hypothetical protein